MNYHPLPTNYHKFYVKCSNERFGINKQKRHRTMKKYYETPDWEVVELETAEMLIEGSGIDMGGEDEPD